jgi:hypothetical protein
MFRKYHICDFVIGEFCSVCVVCGGEPGQGGNSK